MYFVVLGLVIAVLAFYVLSKIILKPNIENRSSINELHVTTAKHDHTLTKTAGGATYERSSIK